jgi:hypothetical protein
MAMKNNTKNMEEKRGNSAFKMTTRKKGKKYEKTIKAGNSV